jgi:HEPN domain-containing protein
MEKKDWEQFLEDGEAFHRTARGSLERPEVFTPDLVQNIAAMAIEKYFMAIFTHRGFMPRNHTMGDLLDEAKTFMAIPDDLDTSLRYFDSLQSICSMDNFLIKKPAPEDAPRFVEAVDRVALLAERELCAG